MKAILLASLSLFAGCAKSPPVASSPPPAEATAPAPPVASAPADPGASTPAAPTAPPAPPEPAIPPYTPAADVPEPIRAAVTAADRSAKDRALDAGRRPAEVLAFFQVAPGQKVGELFSVSGYTTEILARVVGDGGKVYGQNTREMLDRLGRQPLTERLAKPELKNVVMVEQPTETPFPAEARELDAVICILNYHDFAWQKVDRAKMNAAVFAALRPGGIYGIIDHRAAKGSGLRDVQTLHRIDEDLVKKEVTAAGFELDAESDVLSNAEDPRDWNSSPVAAGERRGTSDRFTLRFIKPVKAKPAGKRGKR